MQQPEAGQRQLPAYKSDKTVWALKIAEIQQSPADELSTVDGGTWRLIPENHGYGPITVPHSYIVKHAPQVGGYYVVYADGYASFSPAKAFEEGNTPIDNDAPVASVEQAIKAAGADRAPRVTPTAIGSEIVDEVYFTAAHGVNGELATRGDLRRSHMGPLELLTFCVLVLRNGFTVTGQSACASPENFDADIGRRIARDDAIRQVWPLLGFRLRDQLAAIPADFRDRVRAEKKDLDEKIERLSAFIKSPTYTTLSLEEQGDLHSQRLAMDLYSEYLQKRISHFADGPTKA